jgi:hypothetical protein
LTPILNLYSQNKQCAALYNRGDLCRLLYAYGLRPDLTLNGHTPLSNSFVFISLYKQSTSAFNAGNDTIQGLLEISRDSEDFENHLWRDLKLYIAESPQETNWLWDYVMSNFSGSELLTFQVMIFRDIVSHLDYTSGGDICTTLQILVPKMAKSNLLLGEISRGNTDALVHLWHRPLPFGTESQISGSKYTALLKSLGVDFKRSIEAELEKLPGRLLQPDRLTALARRILFHQDDEQAWVLRWEWVLDEEAPGYLLLLESPHMTYDGFGGLFCTLLWPFSKSRWFKVSDQEGPKWDARRTRRLAKTACKELARTGQKRPRSRMPGAWI